MGTQITACILIDDQILGLIPRDLVAAMMRNQLIFDGAINQADVEWLNSHCVGLVHANESANSLAFEHREEMTLFMVARAGVERSYS